MSDARVCVRCGQPDAGGVYTRAGVCPRCVGLQRITLGHQRITVAWAGKLRKYPAYAAALARAQEQVVTAGDAE